MFSCIIVRSVLCKNLPLENKTLYTSTNDSGLPPCLVNFCEKICDLLKAFSFKNAKDLAFNASSLLFYSIYKNFRPKILVTSIFTNFLKMPCTMMIRAKYLKLSLLNELLIGVVISNRQ